jgi:hypothetical protein
VPATLGQSGREPTAGNSDWLSPLVPPARRPVGRAAQHRLPLGSCHIKARRRASEAGEETGPLFIDDPPLSNDLCGGRISGKPLILLANSDRGPFGRNLGERERAGKANPGRQTPRAEFANRIPSVGKPSRHRPLEAAAAPHRLDGSRIVPPIEGSAARRYTSPRPVGQEGGWHYSPFLGSAAGSASRAALRIHAEPTDLTRRGHRIEFASR